jgi:hypothetical protein
MAYLDIETSPIWPDIQDIIESDSKLTKFEYRILVHTEKEDFTILKLNSLDIVRDYVNFIADQINIDFIMPLGDYVTRLYPYRTNLEVSIKQIKLNETNQSKEPDSDITIVRYKAVFKSDANKSIAGTQFEQVDAETLNISDIINVKLQLLDRSLEPLRIKTVGGVFRNITVNKVLTTVLASESNKVEVDGRPSIDAIDIAPPDNKEQQAHIILTQGLRLTSLPSYLQERMSGVYNAGIGSYFQIYNDKKTWFIYPLFDLQRFDQGMKRLLIYAVPSDRLPAVERTYKVDGDVVSIIANSTTSYSDTADTDYINDGVGFRMSDARSFMKKPVEITEDGPKAKRTRLNHESISKSRDDGLNYAPVTGSGISSNPYKEYSKVLARNVSRISFQWDDPDTDIIYPGMPCKYIFINKDKLVELKGVVLFAHYLTASQGPGLSESVYRTTCYITIVAEKYTYTPDLPTYENVGEF